MEICKAQTQKYADRSLQQLQLPALSTSTPPGYNAMEIPLESNLEGEQIISICWYVVPSSDYFSSPQEAATKK